MDPEALPAALDALEQVLAEQAQALLGGDADALPALARRVQDQLAQVLRTSAGQPVPASLRPRVGRLLQRARANEISVLRRQQETEAALAVLASANPSLQDLQARRVYGESAAFGAPGYRSGGFERV